MRIALRVGILLALFWLAVDAMAVNSWYETPVTVPAGMTELDVIDDEPEWMVVHVRCAVDPRRGGSWGIAWDIADSLNMRRAILDFAPRDVHDDMRLDQAVILRVEALVDGRVESMQSIPLSANIDRDGGFNSLKISYADGGALLCAGSGGEAAALMVPLGMMGGDTHSRHGGLVALYASQPVLCQRLQAECIAAPAVAMSRYTDYDSMVAHIRASADPMEGFWRYLDRNVDASKATLGGVYTIATVAEGDGYQIVYIEGAEIDAARWPRMSLKGRLRPTAFVGNYDMDWYTSGRLLLESETNAQLNDDLSILTCRFPLLGSSIRFARIPLQSPLTP